MACVVVEDSFDDDSCSMWALQRRNKQTNCFGKRNEKQQDENPRMKRTIRENRSGDKIPYEKKNSNMVEELRELKANVEQKNPTILP